MGSDGSDELSAQRAVWASKPLLREAYRRAWEALWRHARPGVTVEVGSGSGNFSEFVPSAITSDIVPRPWLRLAADACRLPLRTRAVDNLVCTDVVHHLPDPVAFLREAARVLRPDGRLLMLEPFISPGSYPVFRFIHHEPVDLSWRASPPSPSPLPERERGPGGDRPNEAIPTVLFFRSKAELARLAPELELLHCEARDWLVYPLSGGYGYPALLPNWLAGAARRVEEAVPLARLAGFRMTVALRRVPDGQYRERSADV
jgi:SAM-dependent methyltransferase